MVATALSICFTYLIIALYCGLITSRVICLLLALSLTLTSKLLLLLVNFLFELNDTGLDPRVLEGLLRSHPLFYLPFKALIDEVNEEIVVTFHHFC